MYKRNIIILGILFIMFLTFGSSVALAQDPGEIIVAVIDEGLEILKDPDMQGMEHFKERKQKIWSIVEPVFDFEETSRRALGRHWISIKPEERKEFTDLFVKVLKNIYLGKTDSYQGENVEYVREIVQDNRGKVQMNFFAEDGKKIVVNFNMHKVAGEWKIYDLIIEGISIVSNYRNQFNSIISKGSFEDLMIKLRKKDEEVSNIN